MTRALGVLFVCGFLSVSAGAADMHSLPLDLSGSEYSRLFQARTRINFADEAVLEPVMELGRRNLQWLEYINKHRDEAHRISFTSKESQQAFPVDAPREYNTTLILAAYRELIANLPPEMASVLVGGAAYTPEPPVAELSYRNWGRKTDVIYQIAMRWLLLSPYLEHYKRARQNDMRGFYHLQREVDLPSKLAGWIDLPTGKKAQLRSWLIGICANTDELQSCEKAFDDASERRGELQTFFNKYIPASRNKYEAFFKMGWLRNDVEWTSKSPDVLRVPFVDPKDARVLGYLRDNIEDEFKWKSWHLKLDFQDGNPAVMSHLRFEAGVTPHMQLPNTIVMDRNQPTTEYDSQWTIRHEFGHIIGFPDCYVEFYEIERSIMVSYQLDITNLMCSRRGEFKQVHFDELKRVYFKN